MINGPFVDFYRDFKISTTFEVVESVNVIKLQKQPDSAALATHFEANGLKFCLPSGEILVGEISSSNLPVDCTFSMAVSMNGVEYPCGNFVAKRYEQGTRQSRIYVSTLPKNVVPATVDLILRTNSKMAEEYLDIPEIWAGEIILKRMPVQPDPRAPFNE